MNLGPRLGTPAIILAPMEGVLDAPLRQLISEYGGYDYAVAEFLRISQDVPPPRVYRTLIPEAHTDWKTAAGLPIQLQLLGGDPERLAQAAALGAKLGAPGVDLNFGCPAPTVNRHDGGATLLKYPHRIRAIVEAVRQAVPRELPVSAKLRLGWDDPRAIHENTERAAEGGASWVTIHGRTKVQGYRPPADWAPIGEVRARLKIPVVANGDLWSLDEFRRCRDLTGCEHFMLGRGGIADLALAPAIRSELFGTVCEARPAPWLPALRRFADLCAREPGATPGFALNRSKQWLALSRAGRSSPVFERAKRATTLADLWQAVGQAVGEP